MKYGVNIVTAQSKNQHLATKKSGIFKMVAKFNMAANIIVF